MNDLGKTPVSTLTSPPDTQPVPGELGNVATSTPVSTTTAPGPTLPVPGELGNVATSTPVSTTTAPGPTLPVPGDLSNVATLTRDSVPGSAEAVAAGAREAGTGEVSLWQVPELVPDEILEKSGAGVARAAFAHLPVAKPTQLAEADAIIFGTPTDFGNMAGQMRNFSIRRAGCGRTVRWSARSGACSPAPHRSTAVRR